MSDTMTPSAKIIAAANESVTLTDANGRVIVWRPMGIFEQYQLAKAAGDHAGNSVAGTLMVLACSVVSIDGVPCPTPRTITDVDNRVKHLGDAGFAAVQAHLESIRAAKDDD